MQTAQWKWRSNIEGGFETSGDTAYGNLIRYGYCRSLFSSFSFESFLVCFEAKTEVFVKVWTFMFTVYFKSSGLEKEEVRGICFFSFRWKEWKLKH